MMQEGRAQGAPAPAVPPRPLGFGRDLTVGSIPRHLIVFSLPMLAGAFLQTAYSFVNRIWVGQYLGRDEMAAITVSFPVVFVLMALAGGLTMATTILISQYYGARNMEAVKKVVNNSTILIGVLSIVLTVAGEVLTPTILRAMDVSPVVLPLASEYMRIFLLSLPLGFALFLCGSMLQGIGDSTTQLYYRTGGILLTAALDPVLMLGLLGAPRMGLCGTAWATVITHVLVLGFMVYRLHKKRNPVAPTFNLRKLDAGTIWTTFRIGMPAAVQQSLISLGMVVVTRFVNGFGDSAVAAFGAAMMIDHLAFMPAMTFSTAVSTLAGQNIGAGRPERIGQIFFWGCVLSGGVTLAASALAVGMPRTLLSIFTPDPAVIDVGEHYLRIVGSGYLLFAMMFVSNGIINGAGDTMWATVISLVSQWGVRIPTAYFLSRAIGIEGIWYAFVLGFAVSMVTSLGYYISGRWRRPVVHARPAPAPSQAQMLSEEAAEV